MKAPSDVSLQYIPHYFPEITEDQHIQLEKLIELLSWWNERINVVSRKDIDALEEKHILHSLTPVHFFSFPGNIRVLDAGSGGGLPGLPLAILFPGVSFHLVDSVGKKTGVIQDIADQLNLENVHVQQERVEKLTGDYHYILARAFTRLIKLYHWTCKKVRKQADTGKPGIIAFKGGDLSEELGELPAQTEQFHLYNSFPLEHYRQKQLIFIPK